MFLFFIFFPWNCAKCKHINSILWLWAFSSLIYDSIYYFECRTVNYLFSRVFLHYPFIVLCCFSFLLFFSLSLCSFVWLCCMVLFGRNFCEKGLKLNRLPIRCYKRSLLFHGLEIWVKMYYIKAFQALPTTTIHNSQFGIHYNL